MIAWYSLARSSFSFSFSCCRVTVTSGIVVVAFAIACSPFEEVCKASDPILHKRDAMKRRSLIASRRIAALAVVLSTALVNAQTRITPPDNNYSPAQDVELGRQAAAEARQQLPVLRDDAVSSYIEGVGRALVAAIPSDLQHPEF